MADANFFSRASVLLLGSSLPFFRRGFYGGLNAYGLPPSTMDTLGSYGYGLSSLECLDRSSQCPYWASTGQCSTGGLYLSRICPQSCGSCLGFGSGLSNGLGAAISTALGSGLGAGLSAGLGSVFNGYNLYGIGGYSGYGTGIGEGLYGENALYGDSLLPYRGLRSGIYPFKYKPSSKTVTASESVKPKSPFKQ
uniref:ShKT domain-containing protein n=1 Tax=Syphacia muris TaxID=451379 RepID=A0A0N5A7Q1_9BILA